MPIELGEVGTSSNGLRAERTGGDELGKKRERDGGEHGDAVAEERATKGRSSQPEQVEWPSTFSRSSGDDKRDQRVENEWNCEGDRVDCGSSVECRGAKFVDVSGLIIPQIIE